MPEYIRIDPEYTDEPDVIHLITNLTLTEGETEHYADADAGEEGSPLAQTLFLIDGIHALTVTPDTLIVTRQPEVEWYVLIDEISTAIKDYYL